MNIFESLKIYSKRTSSERMDNQGYTLPDNLDERQRKVVCLDSGYHLVLAPAGCGKTKVLADRVERAIHNGISPEDMLCLTFTNRASRNMRSRISEIRTLGDRGNELFVGNTHRFCSKFVFENNIINQSSSILDEDDVLSVINSISSYVSPDNDLAEVAALDYKSHKKLTAIVQLQHLMRQFRLNHRQSVLLSKESDFMDDDRTVRFFSPKMFATLCSEAGLAISIESLISIYDNSNSYVQSQEFSHTRSLIEILHIAKQYEEYKKIHNLLDFDDLLIETYDYAINHPDSIHRYKWIQIDEVQDLNPLQFAIVDAFTANVHVTVYLGDEQQAIFSFIGAKLDTLNWLKDRCAGNLHLLNICYRSPKYLLDVFNDYANLELDTDQDFLPIPQKFDPQEYGDLSVRYTYSNKTAPRAVVDLVNQYRKKDERTAVLVSNNAYANEISAQLEKAGIANFKISGTDVFALKQTKFLFAHLNVVNYEINFLAWARILSTLKIIPKYSDARRFVASIKRIGLNPSDLLLYGNSSYLLEYQEDFRDKPIVIFDTETTGLDVYSDDIVQIAANKYINGKLVGMLNILLHTDKKIPAYLGKLDNPLVQEYAKRPHIDRTDGLRKFVDFSEGCVLIGHNVMYDYNILINNCQRDLPDADIPNLFPVVYDTLKLTRLVCPDFKSYKLKDLLTMLSLEGQNTHLADDDILATYSVAKYCYNKGMTLENEIKHWLINNSEISKLFKQKYGEVYKDAITHQYKRQYGSISALVAELKYVYEFYTVRNMIESFDKFEYICNFLEYKVVDKDAEPSLYEQLSNHIMELNTFKEADLCGDKKEDSVIVENVFVATVHKAKGLEFENVIVYGANDDIYPFFSNKKDKEACMEDARKLYVAITRAKKRLCLLAFEHREGVSRWGNHYCFSAELSPFLHNILKCHKFTTIRD